MINLLLPAELKPAGLKRSGGVNGGLGGVPGNEGVRVRNELEPGLCGESLREDSVPISGSGLQRSFLTPATVARAAFLRRADLEAGVLHKDTCGAADSLSA